jgi:hypothetical protein
MPSSVTITDPRALHAALVGASKRAAIAASEARVAEQVGFIEAETAPDGSPQQRNARSTAARKLRDLGHETPLSGYAKRLVSTDEYPITETATGARVAFPYPDRVLDALRSRGYRLWEQTPHVDAVYTRTLQRELDRALRHSAAASARTFTHNLEFPI